MELERVDFGSSHTVSDTLKEYVSLTLEISDFDFYKYVTFNRIVYTIGDAICHLPLREKVYKQRN